jgi:hypothetical protein
MNLPSVVVVLPSFVVVVVVVVVFVVFVDIPSTASRNIAASDI